MSTGSSVPPGSVPGRRSLVVATGNRGKLKELRGLIGDLPLDLLALTDVGAVPDIVEDGQTFRENARKKARTVAEALMMPVLADDSGLEVDVLHGRPGVRSARFAGEGATDAENNAKLLSELRVLDEGSGSANSPITARFVCFLVLWDPTTGTVLEAEGTCEGWITRSPRGQAGFGYDPLFVVRDATAGRTMAELTFEEKSRVSHRARAFESLRAALGEWLRMPS